MKSPYFYDLCSEHYDADYESVEREDDAGFYVRTARRLVGPRPPHAQAGAAAVLEMGCGSGRVLLPMARAGLEVVGLDSSRGMLDRLRGRLEAEPEAVRRRVQAVHGDVRDADLGRTFPLVTAPFRVIQHLLGRDEQRAWLRTVARHLAPGGALLFDVFQPDYRMMSGPPRATIDLDRTDPASGETIHRIATSWHTPELQTFRVRFEWRRGDPEAEEPPPGEGEAAEEGIGANLAEALLADTLSLAETEVRWFTRAELENLLELEGFVVEAVWGDFAGTPHGPDAEEIVILARRG